MTFLLSKNFWRNKSVFYLIGISGLANLFSWIWLVKKLGWQSANLPLHYNIYLGVDWFGKGYRVYLYPFLGLLILLINIAVSSYIYGRHKQVSYLLLSVALFCNLMIVLGVFALIFFLNYYF